MNATGELWPYAYAPKPADGAEFIGPDNVTLTWTPGFGAILHKAYFSEDYDQVSNASGDASLSSLTYKPGPLEREKVYY